VHIVALAAPDEGLGKEVVLLDRDADRLVDAPGALG
jgi:hypothetical protein